MQAIHRKNSRNVKLMFGLIYFFSMLVKAVFGPFITIFLNEKGLSADLIGIVTGINSIVIILTQPIWGIVTDRVGSTRKTLIVSMIGQSLLALTLIFANGFFFLASAFSFYTVFNSAEGPLLDIWCLNSIESLGDKNATGQMKMWGCVGFALSSALSGFAISKLSVLSIIPFYAGVLFLFALCLCFIRGSEKTQKATSFKDMHLTRIFRHSTFRAFLVYVFFMQITHRGSYTFHSLLIRQLGGSDLLVGYSSALMFISEAVIMALLKRLLKRAKALNLVMISSLFFVAWFVMLRQATQPWHVVLSCLMDGPSFALFTMGTLYYIHEISPKDIRATYQTVAYSVYFGLSGIIGNIVCGMIINRYHYKTMYSWGILLTLASTVFFYLWLRCKHPDKAASAT